MKTETKETEQVCPVCGKPIVSRGQCFNVDCQRFKDFFREEQMRSVRSHTRRMAEGLE